MGSRGATGGVVACAAVSLLSAVVMSLSLPSGADATEQGGRTRIILHVRGCDGCRIQPVQNKGNDISYVGDLRRVRNGQVRFDVPTSRTEKMAFSVYAPFDEFAQAGIPMEVVTAFKDKQPGDRVSSRYARGTHQGSACWAGTAESVWRNTLVVTRVRTRGLYGEGRATVAAGYFKVTAPSLPYWLRVSQAAYHASDPSICESSTGRKAVT